MVFSELNSNIGDLERDVTGLNSKMKNNHSFKSLLASQSGTAYTHNLVFNDNIYNYRILYVVHAMGVAKLYNFNGTYNYSEQGSYFNIETGKWYAIKHTVKSVGSDGKSMTLSNEAWINTSTNQGITISAVYGFM